MVQRNRRQRRAEKTIARSQPAVRALAVHEAGHCVARVLTARAIGWDAGEVIDYIEVGSAPIGRGADRGLRSQVVSWGRFLSKPMQEFVAARRPATNPTAGYAPVLDDPDIIPLFAEMRASGIDLDTWFRVKSMVAMFGPMAEAKLIERPFDQVWNSKTSRDDALSLMRAGVLCGMTPEQIAASANENVSIADRSMGRPEVWRAIMTLADNMRPGRMSGRQAAAIIVRALAANQVPS
jgi:hypothetical protein